MTKTCFPWLHTTYLPQMEGTILFTQNCSSSVIWRIMVTQRHKIWNTMLPKYLPYMLEFLIMLEKQVTLKKWFHGMFLDLLFIKTGIHEEFWCSQKYKFTEPKHFDDNTGYLFGPTNMGWIYYKGVDVYWKVGGRASVSEKYILHYLHTLFYI